MDTIAEVRREKLEGALKAIRRDVARLHRDLAYAARDRTYLIYVILLITLVDLLRHTFGFEVGSAVSISIVAVSIYSVVWQLLVLKRVSRLLNEPVEPLWQTDVDLS